jgi:hypothetical protein
MHHENGIGNAQAVKQTIEELAVIDKPVRVAAGYVQLVRITHADEVRSDDASEVLQAGRDVAPEE